MSKFDIEIEEKLRRIVKVEADNLIDAIDFVEEKVNSGEIVLTADDYNDERNIRNFNSTPLKDKLNIKIEYSPTDGIMTILHDDKKEASYVCDTVKDLKNCINVYLDNYMERNEIESSKEEPEMDIER